VPQAAMLVLAGTETRADLGRVVNALQIARELHEAGDEVTVIFDGAGTQWSRRCRMRATSTTACSKDQGQGGRGVKLLRGRLRGKGRDREHRLDLIDEFEGHPSVRKLISNGYQVLTF
jgi:hypothetical protein